MERLATASRPGKWPSRPVDTRQQRVARIVDLRL